MVTGFRRDNPDLRCFTTILLISAVWKQSNAAAEVGFSKQNWLQANRRSTTACSLMQSLLRIQTRAIPASQQPPKCWLGIVSKWKAQKSRRMMWVIFGMPCLLWFMNMRLYPSTSLVAKWWKIHVFMERKSPKKCWKISENCPGNCPENCPERDNFKSGKFEILKKTYASSSGPSEADTAVPVKAFYRHHFPLPLYATSVLLRWF